MFVNGNVFDEDYFWRFNGLKDIYKIWYVIVVESQL